MRAHVCKSLVCFGQVPWSALRTKPVVFRLGRIDIILAEPTVLRPAKPSLPPQPYHARSSSFVNKRWWWWWW